MFFTVQGLSRNICTLSLKSIAAEMSVQISSEKAKVDKYCLIRYLSINFNIFYLTKQPHNIALRELLDEALFRTDEVFGDVFFLALQ